MKKRLKKITILLIAIIILLCLALFIINKNLTGKTIQEIPNTYSYTKAICNSTHCQDYEIYCEKNKTKQIKPITGAIISIDENWKDPRTKKEIERLC